jgi:hypothetical protein
MASLERITGSWPPGGSDPGAGLAREVAAVLREDPAGERLTDPAGWSGEAGTLELSRAKPAVAQVGYGRVSFDRLWGDQPLLASGGQLFRRGIYAHAPSRFAYELGGRWRQLHGACGLSDGSGGSVVFVVTGDGKELWRSKKAGAGPVQRYEIDVTGVKRLELLTEDAGDGNRADWGLWLEPALVR